MREEGLTERTSATEQVKCEILSFILFCGGVFNWVEFNLSKGRV